MKTIGQRLEAFQVAGVKPGFNRHEENGQSAFEDITEASGPCAETQLSALLYLLARCVAGERTSGTIGMALSHMEMVAQNIDAHPLL